MRPRNIFFAVIFSTALFLANLQDARGIGSSADNKGWIKTFFKMPSNEQIKEFRNYSIQDQYSIFICGNQVIHPPAIYLSQPFALGGEDVVGFLRTKLAEENDDLTIRDIVNVLAEISRSKTYGVGKDSSLMKIVNDRVNTMKNDGWKRITSEMLDEIKGGN